MENDSGLELIRTSLTGNVRREMFNGREYLVAPVTMIVPGVLHGNKGPMFYPHEQVVLNPGDWNHMPIVLRHPLDKNGVETSARTAKILEASQLGLVFGAEAEDKLGAEAWFDVLKTKKLSPQTLKAIEQGKKIEVSTGLFTDHFEAEQGATFNGTEYSFIAKNYRPDHLAVLIDEKGACSIKDGCGINVNRADSNLWQTVINWLVGNRVEECSECDEEDLCEKCRNWSTIAPEVPAVNEDFITRIKLHQQIVLPGTDRWIEDARDGLVIYRQQGKTYKQRYQVRGDGELELLENPTEVTRIASYFRKTRGAEDMAKKLTDNERGDMTKFIVANCLPFKDNGKDILAKLTDEQLKTVKTNAEMIQKIRSLKTNAEGDGVVEGVAIADLAEFLGVTVDPANDPVGFVKALTDALDAVRAQLGTPAPDTTVEDPPVDEAVTMSDGEEEEKRKKAMATNKGKTVKREKTLQEWMADAPAPVRSAVTNAMKVEKAEKVKIIKRLVTNLSDDKKVARIKKLQEKSLEELQDIAEMIPEANSGRTQEQEDDDLLADYSIGQGPTTHGVGGAGKGEEDEDFLALPAMTYNRKVGKNRKVETA